MKFKYISAPALVCAAVIAMTADSRVTVTGRAPEDEIPGLTEPQTVIETVKETTVEITETAAVTEAKTTVTTTVTTLEEGKYPLSALMRKLGTYTVKYVCPCRTCGIDRSVMSQMPDVTAVCSDLGEGVKVYIEDVGIRVTQRSNTKTPAGTIYCYVDDHNNYVNKKHVMYILLT